MVFGNAALLAGVTLIGIPILLHLLLRPKPKQLLFPAVRFLQARRTTNQRTLQIRHWLLLFMRCLLVLMIVLALARPSVDSATAGDWTLAAVLAVLGIAVAALAILCFVQGRGRTISLIFAGLAGLLLLGCLWPITRALSAASDELTADREAPVAAVFVIDVAPRMEYRRQNLSRLEIAQASADELIRRLPRDSRIGVVVTKPGPDVFAVDRAAARTRIQGLKTSGVVEPISKSVRRALRLLEQSELDHQEIYVLSDLSAAAWDQQGEASLAQELTRHSAHVYVLDVGVKAPSNWSLGEPRLSGQTLPSGSELVIRFDVRAAGAGGQRQVKLFLEDSDLTRPLVRDGQLVLPNEQQRASEEVVLPDNGAREVVFRIGGLVQGTHQGRIVLEGQDGLAVDDVRYLTVAARPAFPILIAAPQGVDTNTLTEALAPYELRRSNRSRFACTAVGQMELGNQNWDDFEAILLVDPEPLPSALWERLADYVRGGRGLAVFLGPRAGVGKSFNQEVAQQLLPAPLGPVFRAPDNLFLAPTRFTHPILAPYRDRETSTPWHRFGVFRHWGVGAVNPDTTLLINFSNTQPALLERQVGNGNVVMMTTPITEPARPEGRRPWNELTGPNDWPRFLLVNSMASHLVNQRRVPLNYFAGQIVQLPNAEDEHPARYQLFPPTGDLQPVRALENRLTVRTTDVAGSYRLKGDRGGPVVRGFAVNLPPEASELARVSMDQLNDILGADQYRLAEDIQRLERARSGRRTGMEFFPYLLCLMVFALAIEHALANRFYRASSARAA